MQKGEELYLKIKVLILGEKTNDQAPRQKPHIAKI